MAAYKWHKWRKANHKETGPPNKEPEEGPVQVSLDEFLRTEIR